MIGTGTTALQVFSAVGPMALTERRQRYWEKFLERGSLGVWYCFRAVIQEGYKTARLVSDDDKCKCNNICYLVKLELDDSLDDPGNKVNRVFKYREVKE